MSMRKSAIIVGLLSVAGCHKTAAPPALVYQAIPVERRDIVVSASANGTIQPDTIIDVRSQASGEVLQVKVETGQVVKPGDLLVVIDPRIPKNNVDQAKAALDVAQATLLNAKTQLDREEALFKSQTITQTEYDGAVLAYSTAKAGVVTAQVNLQNAQITLDQTQVRAPSPGTIIELDVDRGQIISSPISNAGGGTDLLKMADMNLVQVSTLVDETDIGKIQPGMATSITVDAYPNRTFQGRVLKIEPQATVSQNVTMFPVLIRIDNREGLLKVGMNSEVQIHIGQRDSVLAVPTTALRTSKDVASAADVLGLSMDQVTAQLARNQPHSDSGTTQTMAAAVPTSSNTMTLPDGRTIPLPAGVTEAQVRAIMQKRMSGGQPTADERALVRRVFQGMQRGGGAGAGPQGGTSANPTQGGSYVVFVARNGKPEAVPIRTGLSDLDYAEVVSGLNESDSVLILPSASLIQSQKEFTQRIQRMTGGGLPGMSSNSSKSSTRTGQ